MVVEIPLTQDYVTLVDDDDADLVSSYKWQAIVKPSGVYAHRYPMKDGKRRHIWLARWLMSAPADRDVDHANRDTLDNRRANLRLATKSQNQANTVVQRGNYKGVCRASSHNAWQARIQCLGRPRHLGYFRSEEDAARAYDAAALELFGEFARINFPQVIHEHSPRIDLGNWP